MKIAKEISELVNAGIISDKTAGEIRKYYTQKDLKASNRLFIVFGILGAILTGLGVILIVAHNWDELSRTLKTCLAFIPVIACQLLCFYVLIKKANDIAWRESSSILLFFAVGSVIALISQIYNIPGNLSEFLLTWMLLSVPLIYLMGSSFNSLLYLIGITAYADQSGYGYQSAESYNYWLLLLLALPHYYYLYTHRPKSNFMVFHNWLVPLSLTISLGTLSYQTGELMYIAYLSLFGFFYSLGNTGFFKNQRLFDNGYLIIGALGSIGILLALSFSWFWDNLKKEPLRPDEIITSPEFIGSIIITLCAAVLLYKRNRGNILEIQPVEPVFIIFIIIFNFGWFHSVSVVLVNLLVFAVGIQTIRKGFRVNHLGILNYGLLIITALIICRFFDTELSFVLRGMLFIGVGAGFFAVNYWMHKKRTENG